MKFICFVLYFHLRLLDDESITKRHISVFFRERIRISVNCPIFGYEEDLWHHELPTYESVMKCYLFVRHYLKRETNKDPAVSKIAKYVTEKI